MFNLKVTQELKRFRDNCSGNIAMMTAILGTALFTAAGVAIDYSRAYSVRSEMTNALDAAVLAVGNDLAYRNSPNSDHRKTFDDFFYANILGRGRSQNEFEIVDFTADPATGEVKAVAKANIGTSMMRIAGVDSLEITTESSAIFSISDVEVSIMLDVTGSMRGQKLSDLKKAAKDAVRILMPENRGRGVRIALVPYAGSVNVGGYRNRVTSGNIQLANANGVLATIDQHGADNTCVTERGGAYAATDASYSQARVGNDKRTESASFRCPRASEIVPLTDRRAQLIGNLNRLEASGVTAGHLGIAWSYYTLSENWRNLWPSQSDPAAYSSSTRKIAILMTDGEFNTYYHGTTDPNDPNSAFGNVSQSNSLATSLCEDMKKPKGGKPEGITIYSIAFKAPKSAEQTLRACANENTADETFYFSADNGQELRAAFSSIAASISRLRINR